ncbi:hypothetical protein FGRMN_1421 [Fusarium graminum]|nr:hypothetical protein FGRMN_1421 [Fusarium graminum]
MPRNPGPTTDKDIHPIQLTFKAIYQIAKHLRLCEQDEDRKAFYAKIIVYCTIIESRLTLVRDEFVSSLDDRLSVLLLKPLKQLLTTHFLSLSIHTWPQELSKTYEKIRNIKDNTTKLDVIRTSLDFGTTAEARHAVERSLDLCEEDLRERYPEDSSQWPADDVAPQLKISEPSYAVWNAAQSISRAIGACINCPCTPAHEFGARLCLGTYRKPKSDADLDGDDDIDFNMFLSMKREWQEVLVRTTKERRVQLIVEGDQTLPTSVARIRSQKVKSLCEPIAKAGPKKSLRLVFKVQKNVLFKLQSERTCSLIDRSQNAISLDDFLRSRPECLTEKTKRILAVMLSSSVFHFYNTPWLRSTWSSSDVMFFRTASSSIPLQPFINTQLSETCKLSIEQSAHNLVTQVDPDDIDPDDVLDHKCPTLVTLAMMLLELYFAIPFDILAQKFNVELEAEPQPSLFSRYFDVNYVFEACRKEIPQNSQFYLAVENCLDPQVWQNEEGYELDDRELRVKIYSEVILPLETELSQAYSDIRIEELDQFAQDLDFGSWGRQIHSLRSSTASTTPPSMTQGLNKGAQSLPFHHQRTDSEVNDCRAQRAPSSTKRHLDQPLSRSETNKTTSDLSASSELQDIPLLSYTVGILCALPLELLAVRSLFDATHRNRNLQYIRGDSNSYALGDIHGHTVVAACLPSGEYGTNAAADSASNMKRTFPNIEFCLLVGIGGGAPTKDCDIRLGDVVVSLPIGRYPGVIQYDRGKEVEGSVFELTGSLHPPPRCLMTAISALRSDPDVPNNALESSLDTIIRRVPEPLSRQYQHPGRDEDCLFRIDCHPCQAGTFKERQVERVPRPTDHPEIHYGLIASGNRVLKDASVRDRWAHDHGILCFEMEAAGVVNTFPCLVIRGICDYSDSHKNKRWQQYAAATAAAYAKLLLGYVVANNSTNFDCSSRDESGGTLGLLNEERCYKRQRT